VSNLGAELFNNAGSWSYGVPMDRNESRAPERSPERRDISGPKAILPASSSVEIVVAAVGKGWP
jgi:hypothetical protein